MNQLGLIRLTLGMVAATGLLVACAATQATGLGASNGSTTIHCSDCPTLPVERVIDGDTFQSTNARIRLYGVDTPEQGEPCYEEATERLSELAGDSVKVELGPRQQDRHGRSLFYVFNTDGQSVDEMLVREGLALAWPGDGQHRDVLMAVERKARENQAGCVEAE
jgi:endonuclease YncB( thermonuclease family)